MRWFHIAVIVLFAAAIVIFVVQNFGIVTMTFMGFSARAPLALLVAIVYVLGMATGAHASFYTFAFAIILVQYRWFFARAALGLSADLAAAVVAADFLLASGAGTVIRALPV